MVALLRIIIRLPGGNISTITNAKIKLVIKYCSTVPCSMQFAIRENGAEPGIHHYTINSIIQAQPEIAIVITKSMEDVIVLKTMFLIQMPVYPSLMIQHDHSIERCTQCNISILQHSGRINPFINQYFIMSCFPWASILARQVKHSIF